MTKYKRASLAIMDATPPGHDTTERPWLGCAPDSVFGAPAPEKERIANEAARADVLITQATVAQA